MFARTRILFGAALTALTLIATAAPALAQSGGLKGGFLYSTLKFEDTSDVFDSNNGWTVGIFFGSDKNKTIGVQGELNLLQKGGKSDIGDVKLYYLQMPVLLRVAAGDSVQVYGIVGPAFDFKIGEDAEEFIIVDSWSGIDIGFMAGAGLEFGKLVLEGRGTWGLKNIAASFLSPFEGESVKSTTFALQIGFRFK